MQNEHTILSYIFDERSYTEEQKAVMICSLSNIIPNDQLYHGELSPGHQKFFLNALTEAGFVFMEEYFRIANECANSTQYLIKVLNSLSDTQKEKYTMLFLLFLSDCRSRKDDISGMTNIMFLILEAIGIDKTSQKNIGIKLSGLL
jgi:hypothetical protein